jgi:hypothetical protein
MELNRVKRIVAFSIGVFLAAITPLRADEQACSKAKDAALQTVNTAFGSKNDLLLRIAKALQDKGFDPRKYPVIMPDGTVDPVDLPEVLAKIAFENANAVQNIEEATRDCTNGSSGPEKLSALATFFSTDALASILPKQLTHIDASQILSGSPFGGPGGLIPKARDDILQSLGMNNDIGKLIRDPGCIPNCLGRTPWYSALDQALNTLIAGNVAFNNPQRMTVSRARVVEVKLSTTLPPDELKAQLSQAGNRETAGLEVGDRMSATLNGGAAFDISPSGPQAQPISQRQVTTWTWNVTPKASGTQYLILSFDAILTLNGKDSTRNVKTLTQPIEVEGGGLKRPVNGLSFSRNRLRM